MVSFHFMGNIKTCIPQEITLLTDNFYSKPSDTFLGM